MRTLSSRRRHTSGRASSRQRSPRCRSCARRSKRPHQACACVCRSPRRAGIMTCTPTTTAARQPDPLPRPRRYSAYRSTLGRRATRRISCPPRRRRLGGACRRAVHATHQPQSVPRRVSRSAVWSCTVECPPARQRTYMIVCRRQRARRRRRPRCDAFRCCRLGRARPRPQSGRSKATTSSRNGSRLLEHGQRPFHEISVYCQSEKRGYSYVSGVGEDTVSVRSEKRRYRDEQMVSDLSSLTEGCQNRRVMKRGTRPFTVLPKPRARTDRYSTY